MELYKLLLEIKIPEIIFLIVEVGILLFVIYESVIGHLSYKILKRKRGRPHKSYTTKLMERVSRRLHKAGLR